MRKLKLQMHLSLDNYVNMEDGGKDFKWDHKVIEFCVENLNDVDTILLGRKTAEDLIPFWDDVATNPGHKDFALGKRISETPKIVFSNSVTHNQWKNTDIIKGNFNDEILESQEIKRQKYFSLWRRFFCCFGSSGKFS